MVSEGGRSFVSLLLLLPLFLLGGCAVNPASTPAAMSPAPLDLSGDWHIQSQLLSGPVPPVVGASLDGFLTFSGSQVTGTFRFVDFATAATFPSVCPVAVITVSGSVDGKNVLSLTSASFAGSVVSIQLTLPTTATTAAEAIGTIAVSGPCSLASSAAEGFHFPPVTGTYAGTLSATAITSNLASGTALVSLAVAESSTPTADGQYPATAILHFAAGSCNTSVPLQGTMSGPTLQLAPQSAGPLGLPFGSPIVTFTPDLHGENSLIGSIVFEAAPCTPSTSLPPLPATLYAFSGTLAKQ